MGSAPIQKQYYCINRATYGQETLFNNASVRALKGPYYLFYESQHPSATFNGQVLVVGVKTGAGEISLGRCTTMTHHLM